MSVPNQTPYIIYNANGLTTVFPFEFYIINASDIQVSINGTPVTSGYSVSGAGNVGGGDVIFITPPANGSVVMLERVVPAYRLTDYQDNGDLLADTVNKDFDRLWMAIQRSSVYHGLALRRPLFGGPFNAEGYRLEKLADPVNPQDAATKDYANRVVGGSLNRTLRVLENYIDPLPPVAQLEGKVIGIVDGKPVGLPLQGGSATEVMTQLLAADGLKSIGACVSLNQLKSVTGGYNGQRIFLTSWHQGKNVGGGIFQWDASSTETDDGGCIIQAGGLTGRWIRQRGWEKTPEMYGALGDGVQDDTRYIQMMFRSETYGGVRFSKRYKISDTVYGRPDMHVNATGAEFLMAASVPCFIICAHWDGGFFNYSDLLTDEQIDSRAIALTFVWPYADVTSQAHAKISGVRTMGAHTGLRAMGAHTGLRAGGSLPFKHIKHIEIERCDFGIRAGSSPEKATGIDIESTILSASIYLGKVSVQGIADSPAGAGMKGFRLYSAPGSIRMYDCSMRCATVGPRDIMECFADTILIQGFCAESIINNSPLEAGGPVFIDARTAYIDGLRLPGTKTLQNCTWITLYNCALTFGGFYQTKDTTGTAHSEFLIDVSASVSNSVFGIGNLMFSDIYGAETSQKIVIHGQELPTNVLSKTRIVSGGVVAFLPPDSSSCELFIRGDAVSGVERAFTSRVICVKALDSTTWTVKAETVNTARLPPITYTVEPGSNNLILNSPEDPHEFDIQVKIIALMSGLNAF